MKRLLAIPVMAAFTAISLGACGGDGDPLAGRAFTLNGTNIDALEGAPLRLVFSDGSVDVSGGCNLIGGAYRIEGNSLVLGPMMQTEMACEDERMNQDTAIIDLLQARPTFDIDGATLTLADGESETEWASAES